MTLRRLVANLAALSVLAIASQAAARTCTWRSNSNSLWQSSGPWLCDSGSGPPIAGDTAVFNSSSTRNCTISATSAVAVVSVDATYTGTINMTSPLTVTGAMTIGGGVFTAGSATLQVGSLSITGGSVTLSSGTTTIGGALTNSGGTFSANGGTLILTGSGSLNPGSSLGSLTINATGSTYTLSSALQVAGDLTITAGTLAAAGNALTVSGSWSNSGTVTSPGAVTLTGTSSSLTLKSNGSSFGALTINGGGGTYTMQDALTTTGDLTLTAGTLAAGSYNLQVGGNMSLTSGLFTGGTGTVAVTGNLTMTGGTWTGGTGSATVGGSVNVSNSSSSSDSTLVGYWKLDDTASPAVDSSGNGNSLTWSGTLTTTTAVPSALTSDPRALALTGTQNAASAVLSGISVLRPTTVTLSAWYKATSTDSTAGDVINGSNTYGLRITSTGAMVFKRITDNTAAADWIEYRTTISGVLDGNWHHLVGVITTGTGGGMSLYFDGSAYSGSYWVNGTSGATQLTSSTTPTASTAATSALDWDANTEGWGFVVGNNPTTTGYQFGKNCSGTACAIDDVRVYNRALTSTDVAALARGSNPSSTAGVFSLSGALSASGSVTVQSSGTLTLNSGGSLSVGTSLTMDGTLNSTGGTIKAVSTNYAFKVGSASGATPTLNINGLTVKNTDTNGMWINANTGATTTFTRFDKLAFSSGTGTQLLQIYAPSLFLTANGCTFDSSATYAITLTGNGTGSGAGPRALFGNATCGTNDATGLCATSQKSDDDANNDGVADHPTTNGAVVQFVRSGQSDTAGTIVGFPTAAFDWNTYAFYSTYVAFHDASAGSDVIYVRDQSGNPLYSWTDPSPDETIVGTPRWVTSSGTHYLYVAVNGGSSNTGKIYRLTDSSTGTTSGTLTVDSTWATSGAYSCTCTVSSNLSLDASNLYWAATTSTAQVLMGITQSGGAKISTSWPVTTPANVTTSSPTLVTISGTTTLYLGITADLLQLAVTGTTFVQNTKPGTINGRVTFGVSSLSSTSGTQRVYAGDSGGTMWAISPSNFSGTNFLWSYAAGSGITNNTYDGSTDTVMFGTSGGKVVVLNASTGAVLNSSYPYTLDSSDPITAAPLYNSGVLVVGSTKGKLYFLDRNTGSGLSIIKTYSFGSSETISTVSFDASTSRYMVSTSSSSASDGRLYYFDLVSDPTSSSK